MNPERNDVRIERGDLGFASLNKVNGASRPATPWGLVLILKNVQFGSTTLKFSDRDVGFFVIDDETFDTVILTLEDDGSSS